MKNLRFLAALVAIIFSVVACKKNTSCEEKTRSSVACTTDYTPVCGCNDKTYSNACEAEAHGITEFTSGECK